MKVLLLCLACLIPLAAAAQTRVPQSQAEITLGFAPLVRDTAPAVVNIYVRFVTEARARTPFMDDPFFERFFEGLGRPSPQVQNSLGSGVILSADGIVVSNYHVVGQATEISVVLNDGTEYDARVLLGDEASDLAILQIEGAPDLPYLPLRDSETVEVGELVLAIGNPFGVGQTVTSGIVSALARSGGQNGRGAGYFVQTDAPINPGNSGGALIDVVGRLIGVNTRILSRSGGSNGIGFAIPSDLVAAVLRQARDGNDRFQRPWAGATGQAVDADMADSLGLSRPQGIILAGLHPASPFGAAGMAPGDVVLAVDDKPVGSPGEMLYRMAVASVRDTARITWLRDGEEISAEVNLIPPPETPARDEINLPEGTSLPGLELARVNPAVIAEIGLPLSAQGTVVIDPGAIGRRVGLRRGDILQRIDRADIDGPATAAAILSEARRGTTVRALRGTGRIVLRF
ncbi:MAG: trypsin-like peptidase domain-containing protein [Pseudomonadota bacterium]